MRTVAILVLLTGCGTRTGGAPSGPAPVEATLVIAAGVASIEHGGLIDAANVAAMRARGVVWVATLHRIDAALARYPEGPQKTASAADRTLAFAHAKAAIAAGVPLALGTDALLIPHGDNARELARSAMWCS